MVYEESESGDELEVEDPFDQSGSDEDENEEEGDDEDFDMD